MDNFDFNTCPRIVKLGKVVQGFDVGKDCQKLQNSGGCKKGLKTGVPTQECIKKVLEVIDCK